jgi:multidrug resistance efflux pump
VRVGLPRTRRGRFLAAAAAGAVVLSAWAAVTRVGFRGSGEWTRVKRGELLLTVPVSGTLKAVASELIGPPQVGDTWDYKIAFMAPEGSEVKPGQPVLRFDTSELQRELDKKNAEADQARQEAEKRRSELAVADEDARLQLAEAEAALRRADLKMEIPPELQAGNEVKGAALDREQAGDQVRYLKEKEANDAKAANAEIARLRELERRASGRVGEIRDAIARMTVAAPRTGTVIYLSDWRDEKRKVGDTIWRGDKVMEIPDLSRMMAVGQVDEADAGRLAAGQKVTLKLDAHPDVEFSGTVGRIAQAVERKTRSSIEKVVGVEVALDATDRMRMRPGMRFVGKVEVERITGTVLLPVEAVVTTPEGPVVVRRTLFGRRETRVRTGARNDEFVQVVEGLEAGDSVERRPEGGGGR